MATMQSVIGTFVYKEATSAVTKKLPGTRHKLLMSCIKSVLSFKYDGREGR